MPLQKVDKIWMDGELVDWADATVFSFHAVKIVTTGEGIKSRIRAESFADHYSQARQFYVSQTLVEQQHIADALGVRGALLRFAWQVMSLRRLSSRPPPRSRSRS